MRSPAQAMLWELWRLTRWEFILRTVAMSVFGCAIFYAVGKAAPIVGTLVPGGSDPRIALTVPVIGLAMMMCLFSGVWMNSLDSRVVGFQFKLGFARPVATPLLVGLPMLFITLFTGVTYLIPAALIRWLYPVPFPLVSVTAVLVTMCATFIMAVWSPQHLIPRILSFFLVMGVWILAGALWAKQHAEGIDPLSATRESLLATFSFSALQYTVLFICYVAAIVVTIVMVERQRHGDGLEPSRLFRLLAERGQGAACTRQPFPRPCRAQFWFEMRRAGIPLMWIGLVSAAGAFVLLSVVQLLGDSREEIAIMWLILAAGSPAAYMLVGTEWLLGLSRRQGAVSLSAFEATQGIGNTRLLLLKFVVLTMSVFVGWLLMLIAGVTWVVLFEALPEWHGIRRSIDPHSSIHPAALGLMAFYALVVVYTTASAMLYAGGLFIAHRPWPFGAVSFALMVYLGLAAWDSLHGWRLRLLWEIHGWVLAGALVVGAYLALRTCVKRRYFNLPFLSALLCAWALYLFVVAKAASGLPLAEALPVSLPAVALALASLTIPLSAVALAPLSLAAHRHS